MATLKDIATLFNPAEAAGGGKFSLAPAATATASKPGLRTLFAGVCFIGVALAFLPGIFFTSPNLEDAAGGLAAVTSNSADFLIMTLFDLLYAILLVPALLGAAGLPAGRGAGLAYTGAGLALFGNLGHAVVVTFSLIVRQMAAAETDREQMIALMNRINDDLILLFILPMLLAYAIGLLVMVVGLWRARIVPVVPVILIAAAVVLDLGPGGGFGYTFKVILASIVFVWIGLALLRRRNPAPTI